MASILTSRYMPIILSIKITEKPMSTAPFAPAGIDHIVLRVADVRARPRLL